MNHIFIRIPKTGSTSICKALPKPFVHKPALVWREELGEEFDSAFKFTIVRNPYTRFISMFNFFGVFHRYGVDDPNDFLANVDWEEFIKRPDAELARPQSDYIFDTEDNSLLDYIGRFETLHEDWEYIKNKLGLNTELGHFRKRWRETAPLTDASKELIYQRYRKDFELLGYQR